MPLSWLLIKGTTTIATTAPRVAASAPNTGVHWAAIFTAIGIVFAALGAIWAGRQVEEATRSRQAGAVIDMAARWDSDTMLAARQTSGQFETGEDLKRWFLDARDNEKAEYYTIQRIPNFFEDLGIRERLECVDLEVVRLTLGSAVMDAWKLWEPTIREMRAGQPTVWENFEQLAKKLSEASRTNYRLGFGRGSTGRSRMTAPLTLVTVSLLSAISALALRRLFLSFRRSYLEQRS